MDLKDILTIKNPSCCGKLFYKMVLINKKINNKLIFTTLKILN